MDLLKGVHRFWHRPGLWSQSLLWLIVAILGGWTVVAWQNPGYEGKRLHEWLQGLDDRSPVQRVGNGSRLEILMRRPADLPKDLLDAFQHFGSHAVPMLDHRFHRSKPAWHAWISRLPGRLGNFRNVLPDIEVQRAQALHGLTLLGREGVAASPGLIRSLTEGKRIWESSFVLSRIGPSVVPDLLMVFNEAIDDEIRAAAVWALTEMEPDDVHPDFLSTFMDALDSAGPQAETMLVRAIARMAPPEERVIQVLADRLDHPEPGIVALARWGLRRHGRRAEQATPQILGVMRAGGPRRSDLVELLHAVNPEAAAAAGLR
jgi:hypothetical protein